MSSNRAGARAMSQGKDGGYALIAAIAAVALFALLALDAIGNGRSTLVEVAASRDRARMAAAADAGTALAIAALGSDDPAARWAAGDPVHVVDFAGMTLAITIADEGGKVPLNFIQVPQIRALFQAAGADARDLDTLVAEFRSLRGDPGMGQGILAGNAAGLTALDELTLLPHMTPALFARLLPATTVAVTTLAFDPTTAGPLALAVMAPSLRDTPADIERQREQAGQRTALTIAPTIDRTLRTVSIKVAVDADHDMRLHRSVIVEFTGVVTNPYLVRYFD